MNNFIKVFDHVISLDRCAYYINLIDTSQQFPGNIVRDGTSKVVSDVKNSLDVCISGDHPNEMNFWLPLVTKVVDMYSDYLNLTVPVTTCEYITGRVYKKNEGYYHKHVDAQSPITVSRSLTMLFYLNDIEEGGETFFPYQDVIIKPKAGSVLCFPPYWMFPHGGKVPVSNDKYMVRTFTRVQ